MSRLYLHTCVAVAFAAIASAAGAQDVLPEKPIDVTGIVGKTEQGVRHPESICGDGRYSLKVGASEPYETYILISQRDQQEAQLAKLLGHSAHVVGRWKQELHRCGGKNQPPGECAEFACNFITIENIILSP